MKLYRWFFLLLPPLLLMPLHYADAAVTFPLKPNTPSISADPCNGTYRAKVLFVNGIWNAIEDARDSRDELQKRFQAYSGATALTCVKFELGYNQSEALLDLAEAFEQWKGEITTEFWLGLSDIVPFDEGLYFLIEVVLNATAEAVQADYDSDQYFKDKDLQTFLRTATEFTDEGKPVLLVGHSQGNFYTNQVYRLLNRADISAVVAVATPASKVEGPLGHVTLYGDIILKVPLALPANTWNGWFGVLKTAFGTHKFITSYMAGDQSREKILDMMVGYLREVGVEPPTATLSASPLSIEEGESATLSWSSTNANLCDGTGFSTSGATSGAASVSPAQTTNYGVTCTGGGGAATATVTVTVTYGPPSTEFTTGDSVAVIGETGASVTVWDAPNGNVVGTQEAGTRGEVVGGPQYSTTLVAWMWQVDFESGADGWVAEQFLQKEGGTTEACVPYNQDSNPNPVLPCSYNGYDYDSLAVEAQVNSFFYKEANYTLYDNDWWWALNSQTNETCDGLMIAWGSSNCAPNLSFSKIGALFFGVGSTPLPSQGFLVRDAVEVTESGVNVRGEPNGAILGTQSPGIQGTVSTGARVAGGYWWWWVDFESGVDGWVAEEFLREVVGGVGTNHPL